jgi:uncharacterized protein YraI
MRLAPQLLSVGVLLAFASAAAAKPASVLTTVNLRAAPGTGSEIITKIPGGSLIDAGGCSDGWCEVTWQEKSGFAIQTSLDLSGRVPVRRSAPSPAQVRASAPQTAYGSPPPGYVVEEPVYVGPPPVYYYRYGPYWRHRYWRHW